MFSAPILVYAGMGFSLLFVFVFHTPLLRRLLHGGLLRETLLRNLFPIPLVGCLLVWLTYAPMADIMETMEFIETPTFTRLVTGLLSDDSYRGLQNELAGDPERGDIIKGGGGIRKLRYAVQGRGKSGGVRVIYYWIKDNHQIYLLVVYPKSKKDTLTDKETAMLRELVKEL